MTKFSVRLTPYLNMRTSYDYGFCYTSVKWYLQQFLFQNFDFGGILDGWKSKNWPKITSLSPSCSLYQEHIIEVFGTQV